MLKNSIKVTISLSLLSDIRKILIDSRENALELLAIHDESLGRTTKKNLCTAVMYENEIKAINDSVYKISGIIKDISEKNKLPGYVKSH